MAAIELLFPIGIGLAFAILHFYSDALHRLAGPQKAAIQSLIAGATVAYVFFQLYPQTILATEIAGFDLAQVFLFVGGGFALIFLLEQFLHAGEKGERRVHILVFALLQIVIGLLIMLFFSFNRVQGWMFFAWAALFSTVTQYSLGAMNPQGTQKKVLLSVATLVGVLAATFLPIPVGSLLLVQAVAAGVLPYLALREMLPAPGQGKPVLFLVGLIIAAGAILFL